MAVNERRIRRTFFGIGASAGGIEAIVRILDRLPSTLEATIGIVIHRSPSHASLLARILQHRSPLSVIEPRDGEPVKLGRIYLAPRNFHMLVGPDNVWRLDGGLPQHRWRPAVDPFLKSAATHFGERTVGVLLSGGGADGVEGFVAIKGQGGLTIAQDPRQSMQDSMRKAAIQYDDVDLVLRAEAVASVIPRLAAGDLISDDFGVEGLSNGGELAAGGTDR